MTGHRPSPDILFEELNAALRAALYMRVSTGRQAEHDLSIPDQRGQLKSWCSANGYFVVAEYVEAGASAVDDRRPSFQQMILIVSIRRLQDRRGGPSIGKAITLRMTKDSSGWRSRQRILRAGGGDAPNTLALLRMGHEFSPSDANCHATLPRGVVEKIPPKGPPGTCRPGSARPRRGRSACFLTCYYHARPKVCG